MGFGVFSVEGASDNGDAVEVTEIEDGDGKIRVTGAFNKCGMQYRLQALNWLKALLLILEVTVIPLTISQRLFFRCCKEFQRSLFKEMRLR
ncbi:hypothetical protein POTOM_051283 [Populus tomentosa]|uniref:Uncharacterized protein n=1 Tax=Populus tomentosa TaxID=118781 RepID=A0A8X7Y5R6_POPTO|nr:hypothetical protein POTOM_051283 [Populus tomentosa]